MSFENPFDQQTHSSGTDPKEGYELGEASQEPEMGLVNPEATPELGLEPVSAANKQKSGQDDIPVTLLNKDPEKFVAEQTLEDDERDHPDTSETRH